MMKTKRRKKMLVSFNFIFIEFFKSNFVCVTSEVFWLLKI